ncbi:MAG: hypothetical protein F4065_08710 [Rhodothermaceae bacterium]|nr:hypothetical protein [Rhodothermaceae bacterium]MXZ56858.1 hypothetical protein [Rhodothermaceae bacterium]MYB91405.1 hypothetical protein [Rhodothermaceae bacterium]MYD67893.1 hypothetical protein [Rhodothermaceae bacterium]MYG43516.1 hypothetical protein [Rhodothermaceae bacterium]
MTTSGSLLQRVLLIVIVLPFSAYAQQDSFKAVNIDSSKVQIKTSDPANSTATCTVSDEPILVIGDNEEDEYQIFSSIRGTGRLSDGSIAVADRTSAEIRIFDEAGQHLRSMGRRGNGPGEFKNPFILWVAEGDTIWVGDYRPWRYKLFTSKGDFIRQVSLEPEYLNPSSAGGGVLDNGFTVNTIRKGVRGADFTVDDTLIVEVHDPRGTLKGSLVRMPNRPARPLREGALFMVSPLFSSWAMVDARGETIALAHGSKPEVQILDSNLNLKTIIRWIDPPREVKRNDIRASRQNYRNARDPSRWGESDDDMVSRDRPVADFFPALSRVEVGRDGWIWVRKYNRPGEDGGWLAFNGDGEFVCHMATLPGSPDEFGEDYVLLLGESESGAETVQLHRLSRPF